MRDTVAAATELGYVLTFLLGLSFLSVFSIWTWELQDERGDVWLEQAMEENLDSIAESSSDTKIYLIFLNSMELVL